MMLYLKKGIPIDTLPAPHFSQKAKACAGIGDKSMAEEEICSLSCKVNRLTHGYHPCPLPDRHFL